MMYDVLLLMLLNRCVLLLCVLFRCLTQTVLFVVFVLCLDLFKHSYYHTCRSCACAMHTPFVFHTVCAIFAFVGGERSHMEPTIPPPLSPHPTPYCIYLCICLVIIANVRFI